MSIDLALRLFPKPGSNFGSVVLVVFEDNVLLFSDKHCSFRGDKPSDVAWRRWYTAAVLDSAGQLYGAERWLTNFPDRVFVDRACNHKLPISFPSIPTFHRILTCRGASQISRNIWGGTGSLFATNAPLRRCIDEPFRLGAFDERGRMYHVFEEVALDAVLRSLDTVSDFCEYLRKREAFFRRDAEIVAAGEDELLGFYLWGHREGVRGHDFIVDHPATHIVIDESFWADWQRSAQRRAKEKADQVSYAWDRLIEKFSHHMRAGTLERLVTPVGDVSELERSVRWMAREPRFMRRMLAHALIEVMENTSPGQLRRRLVPPVDQGDPYWVFLVLPRKATVGYAEYREFRQRFLIAHCLVVKYLYPDAQDILALAVEPPNAEMSEDIVYFDAREWNDDLNERARRLHEEGRIFETRQQTTSTAWEYPIGAPSAPRPNRRDKRTYRKMKRKEQRNQRKKNRR